jgi:hypothetical protein
MRRVVRSMYSDCVTLEASRSARPGGRAVDIARGAHASHARVIEGSAKDAPRSLRRSATPIQPLLCRTGSSGGSDCRLVGIEVVPASGRRIRAWNSFCLRRQSCSKSSSTVSQASSGPVRPFWLHSSRWGSGSPHCATMTGWHRPAPAGRASFGSMVQRVWSLPARRHSATVWRSRLTHQSSKNTGDCS